MHTRGQRICQFVMQRNVHFKGGQIDSRQWQSASRATCKKGIGERADTRARVKQPAFVGNCRRKQTRHELCGACGREELPEQRLRLRGRRTRYAETCFFYDGMHGIKITNGLTPQV